MLSALSALIRQFKLRFLVTSDADMSCLAHRAVTLLRQQQCLQATPSVGSSSSWDRPVYSAGTFGMLSMMFMYYVFWSLL